MRKIIFILLTIAFLVNGSIAQVGQKVSKEEFNSLKEELDYSDTKRTLTPRSIPKPKPKPEIKDIPDPSDVLSNLGVILNFIAIGFIILVVIAVLYAVFSTLVFKRRNKTKTIVYKEEEEHIEEKDLDATFDLAYAEGDLRNALRIRFLKVLQHLSLQNAIHWRAEKTNRDYARELRGTRYYDSYKHLSDIFEYVWYGNELIDEELFQSCLLEFDHFNITDS